MASDTVRVYDPDSKTYVDSPVVKKTPQEWKEQLTAIQYNVARENGTERPFENLYNHNSKKGIYKCACLRGNVTKSIIIVTCHNYL